MDFHPVWCPVCDRQISSKHHTEIVQPPGPPQSKNKGNLLEGTDACKQARIPPIISIAIDQGPLPYYCSDKSRIIDSNPRVLPRDYGPICVQQTTPDLTPKPNHEGESPSMAYSAIRCNFPTPPQPFSPGSDDDEPFDVNSPPPKPQYTCGVIAANTYSHSLISKAKLERKGIAKGWNDGSNAWRTTAYSLPSDSNDHLAARPAHALSTSAHTPRASRSAPHQYDAATSSLMAQFSASLSRRSESRLSSRNSPPHSHQVKERPLIPDALIGKLLVPDVKCKVGFNNAESLPNYCASEVSHLNRPHCPPIWSSPSVDSMSTLSGSDNSILANIEDEDLPLDYALNNQPRCRSSRESETQVLRRGLTGLSIGDNLNKAFMPLKRSSGQSRPWSYDNVHTYEAMQMPNPNAKLWNFPERAV